MKVILTDKDGNTHEFGDATEFKVQKDDGEFIIQHSYATSKKVYETMINKTPVNYVFEAMPAELIASMTERPLPGDLRGQPEYGAILDDDWNNKGRTLFGMPIKVNEHMPDDELWFEPPVVDNGRFEPGELTKLRTKGIMVENLPKITPRKEWGPAFKIDINGETGGDDDTD